MTEWSSQQERLLFAAQAIVQNSNEHEEARDGEPVITVDPDDYAELKRVVQEISDDAIKMLRATT